MRGLKTLIVEIHRRSLWQVLAVYLGASWMVLQASDHVVQRYLLPEWVYAGAVLLVLIGLPIVLATAVVREEPRAPHSPTDPAEVRPPIRGLGGPNAEPAARRAEGSGSGGSWRSLADALRSSPIGFLLTWPRAIAGGVLAFLALSVLGAFVVVQGIPRVAAARGFATDAFHEGSWVVVAEFEADEEDAAVALAAREALTVDLQQSRHTNVYARSQVASVLGRMGLPATTRLEPALALEVAERTGAGAVLTVTVSRLGPTYVLFGRALRPGTGEELFAVRAAAGSERLLEGVETLSREFRRRLGEEREAIRHSRPLPQVTTRSLEALKVYAQAEMAVNLREGDRATSLVAEAIRIDPGFAMAHRLAAANAFNLLQMGRARHHVTRAYELRDRLTERERWHIEALYHMAVELEPRRAAEVYELLLTRYPDDFRAANNLGVAYNFWMSNTERSYPAFRRAAELDPHSVISLHNATVAALQLGLVEASDSLAHLKEVRGFRDVAVRWRAARAFAMGDVLGATAMCDSIIAAGPQSFAFTDDRELCGAMALTRGRIRVGMARLEEVERIYSERRRYRNLANTAQALAIAEGVLDGSAPAGGRIVSFLELVPADSIPEPDRFLIRTDLRVAASLLGRPDLAAAVESTYPPFPDPGHWLGRTGEALARAGTSLAQGDPEAALQTLRGGVDPSLRPLEWRLWDELLRGLAFQATGQPDSAAVRFERAAAPGYVGSLLLTTSRLHLPLVIRKLAETEAERGNVDEAVRQYRRLLELWADADPELQGDIAAVRTALARLAGGPD